jgi:hypothetical protein
VPGDKGGPVGVKTPVELGGTRREGKGGNKTQAVALSLLERLPKKPYHLWMDNLFTSTRFLELLLEGLLRNQYTWPNRGCLVGYNGSLQGSRLRW